MNNLHFAKVKSVRRISRKGRVFNFDVPKFETYIANGIVVHNCQNWEISQARKGAGGDAGLSPEAVVAMAKEKGVGGVAFTYSEPFVWFEYVMDVAKAVRAAGLKTILKTAAFGHPDKFREMCQAMDAINVDFKGTPRLYKDICKIDRTEYVDNVWWNLRTAWRTCHTEVSTLAIPDYMDKEERKKVLTDIDGATCHSCPIHILKFIPDFRMLSVRPPSDSELDHYERDARERFRYVYVDFAMRRNDTVCECGHVMVKRDGISMDGKDVTAGHACPACSRHHYFNGCLGSQRFPAKF